MPTPFERVKSAWDSDDREAELNRVVEVMAREGVTRDALDDALGALLEEVRAGGADDTTEEIINCVGDRLHGWCHADWHIKARAAATPTEDEIAALPKWARVAFAARCARRLLPLLALNTTPDAAVRQVVQVVDATEQAAVDGNGEAMLEMWGEALKAAKAFRDQNLPLPEAVADTAYRAALLAFGEGYVARREPGVVYKSTSANAWDQTVQIARAVGTDLTEVIRNDFDQLMQTFREQSWPEDAPVPASLFDLPLWPLGLPVGWPNGGSETLAITNGT